MTGATGLAAGGLAGAGLETASAAGGSAPAGGRVIPFHGAHQAGITTATAQATVHAAFDLTARDRRELTELLAAITGRARFLTGGGTPPDLGISAPPSDSGTLGPAVVPDGLTVTVALGASAYDRRFGLAGQKPIRLRTMETFADDDLDRDNCDGDLLLTLGADHQDTVLHALRDITRHTRGGMQLRWRISGFTFPPRPSGTPRNLFGFKDGIANPDVTSAASMDSLVWTRHGSGEPASAVGGSYQVVRVIRMLIEFWDRVTIGEQERMFGRRKDTGAPLSGQDEKDVPDYGNDPLGSTIPLDAHIRLANPRTPKTASSQILRRGYTYDNGIDRNGNLDTGLVFTCFQQDLERQFVAVQSRLAGEPLVDYVLPVGGGYYYALPGVTGPSDIYGRALLAT
jgi:deferrochelatase/peroxidase EfeB